MPREIQHASVSQAILTLQQYLQIRKKDKNAEIVAVYFCRNPLLGMHMLMLMLMPSDLISFDTLRYDTYDTISTYCCKQFFVSEQITPTPTFRT